MKKRKIVSCILLILTVNCFWANLGKTNAFTDYIDTEKDVLYFKNGIYKSTGKYHPEIDIISIRYSSFHVILTLKESVIIDEEHYYEVVLYWNEVVTSKINEFNRTICSFRNDICEIYTIYEFSNGTILVQGGGDNDDLGLYTTDNALHWRIDYLFFELTIEPKMIIASTIYPYTDDLLYLITPALDFYRDYYPNEIQTYYTGNVNIQSEVVFIAFFFMYIFVINKRKQRKKEKLLKTIE
ncbi:MAG: hypothetical protein EAX90_12910 [Candidatus Heimdallarchaeota archaeon]|nr:hypothetical protein [Candidatus Heimdallarchaeota archaeon]